MYLPISTKTPAPQRTPAKKPRRTVPEEVSEDDNKDSYEYFVDESPGETLAEVLKKNEIIRKESGALTEPRRRRRRMRSFASRQLPSTLR